MKRLLVFLIVLISITAFASLVSAETYIVNPEVDVLNIRSQYDSDIILGGIRGGKKIELDSHDRYWGYFTYNDTPAKVYMDYLTPSSSTSTSGTTTTVSTGGKKGNSSSSKATQVSSDVTTMVYHVSDTVRSHISVRAKKNDKAKILGRLDPGDEVNVVAIGKTWARIVYNNQYGFVYSKYLVDCGDNLPDGGELYKVSVKKNTTLNVRKEPRKKSKLVTRLRNGTLVKVFEKHEKWSFVYFNVEDFGYVMNKFLVKVE